jgi:hypothetical protein
MLFIVWAEDKALLESNLSAATGGHTERQGTLPCLFLSCLSGGLQSDKLRACGGRAPTGSWLDGLLRAFHHFIGADAFALQAFLEPVTLPVAGEDVGFVGQAIQQRRGEGGLAEDLGPVGKAQVGGDNDRPPFVPLRQDLEK